MKSINECINEKDWKALAKITSNQIRYIKNKEALDRENNYRGYETNKAYRLKERMRVK